MADPSSGAADSDASATIAAAIDLSDRAKLRFRGPDRVRFLNGQVSNDVRRADDENVLPACVCNLKGKLDALVMITASGRGDDAALLVDGPPELRADEALSNRFDRYLIADQVELNDVSGEFALWHFLPGVDRPDLPGAVWKKSNRFGVEGEDLWLTADSAAKFATDFTPLNPDDPRVELLRIRNCVPKWGAELNSDILPAEARLDATAVDFHKGCYTGQEVVSRIQSVGRVNRTLSRLSVVSPAQIPQPGDELFPEGGEAISSKPAGRITSVALDADADCLWVLAYLRRGHDQSGMTLRLVTPGQSASLDSRTVLIVNQD